MNLFLITNVLVFQNTTKTINKTIMDQLLEALDTLSVEELEILEHKIYNTKEIKSYFMGLIDAHDFELPEKALDLSSRIKVLNVEKDLDIYMYFEEGNAYDIVLQITPTENDQIPININLRFIQHNTKHTFTEYRSITLDGKFYEFGFGDHINGHLKNSGSIEDTEYIFRTLHDTLEIPYSETAKMIHLLFFPYSFYPYIQDKIESLEDILEE